MPIVCLSKMWFHIDEPSELYFERYVVHGILSALQGSIPRGYPSDRYPSHRHSSWTARDIVFSIVGSLMLELQVCDRCDRVRRHPCYPTDKGCYRVTRDSECLPSKTWPDESLARYDDSLVFDVCQVFDLIV